MKKTSTKKRKYNLTTVLISVLLVFTLAMLGMIYIFQISFLDSFYQMSKIEDMGKILTQMEQRSRGDLNYVVDAISKSNGNACIAFYIDGTDYVAEDDTGICPLYWLASEQFEKMLTMSVDNNGEGVFDINYQKKIDTYAQGLMAVTKVTEIDGNKLLMISSDKVETLNPVIGTIQMQFYYITAYVIIFTIILALILSIVFIRPLKKINEEAKSLPLGIYGSDEVKSSIQEMDDINETLKESCVAIEQSEIARKELLSNVSHDLRTPLTMIVGYGEMMIDFDDEKTNENIKLIIDEAKRLSNLVNDLLDLSKAELGKLDLNLTSVSLNEYLTSIYNQYKGYLESQNIKFTLSLDKDFTCILDDERMRQVLYNFINNAMNYNDKDNPEITLYSKYKDGIIQVGVLDNGKGIAKEDLEKIWDRYYKVDKEHKRSLIGSGIGLSLAKMILETHGFNYGVISKKGKYSNFFFKLKEGKDTQ